jgi:endonuclease/exonuclease/phosphatase (EEP) superfamily protein YafD
VAVLVLCERIPECVLGGLTAAFPETRNVFYFEKTAAALLNTVPAKNVICDALPDVAAAAALLTVGQVGSRRGWREQQGDAAATADEEADILLQPLGLTADPVRN